MKDVETIPMILKCEASGACVFRTWSPLRKAVRHEQD
jgi:hypothetical protein